MLCYVMLSKLRYVAILSKAKYASTSCMLVANKTLHHDDSFLASTKAPQFVHPLYKDSKAGVASDKSVCVYDSMIVYHVMCFSLDANFANSRNPSTMLVLLNIELLLYLYSKRFFQSKGHLKESS